MVPSMDSPPAIIKHQQRQAGLEVTQNLEARVGCPAKDGRKNVNQWFIFSRGGLLLIPLLKKKGVKETSDFFLLFV